MRARERRADSSAARSEERPDLGVVVTVVMAEHEGCPGLRLERGQGVLDDPPSNDVRGRVGARAGPDLADRRPAEAWQREPTDAAPPELVERQMHDDPMEPREHR